MTRPEKAAMREAARTSGELDELGLDNQQLVINAIFEATRPQRSRRTSLSNSAVVRRSTQMPDVLRSLPTERVPLRPFNMVGLPALRALLGSTTELETPVSASLRPELPPLASLFDDLARAGTWPDHGHGQGRRRQDHDRRRRCSRARVARLPGPPQHDGSSRACHLHTRRRGSGPEGRAGSIRKSRPKRTSRT